MKHQQTDLLSDLDTEIIALMAISMLMLVLFIIDLSQLLKEIMFRLVFQYQKAIILFFIFFYQ